MLFATIIFLLIVLLFFTIQSSLIGTSTVYDKLITSKGNNLVLNAHCAGEDICYDRLVAIINPYKMEITYINPEYSVQDKSIRQGIKEILLKNGINVDVFNDDLIIKDNRIFLN